MHKTFSYDQTHADPNAPLNPYHEGELNITPEEKEELKAATFKFVHALNIDQEYAVKETAVQLVHLIQRIVHKG